MMGSYRELRVWEKAMDLVVEIYKLCKYLPKEETYGLSDQMRRASVSIPSNIAEGEGRKNNKEFIRYLYIAQGSISELQTQLEICVRLGYIPNEQIAAAENYTEEIGRMITKLIRNLQQQISKDREPTTTNQQPSTNN